MIKQNKNEQKFHPYKRGFISSLPLWFKVTFFKWWIAGMAYMFLGFGSVFLRPGSYEQSISIGSVIGLLTSYIVNRIIRDMTHLEDHENYYLSIKKEGPIGTLTNVALSIIIVIIIHFTYNGINRLFIAILSLDLNIVFFPAEPFGFACFYLFYDFIWRKLTFRGKKHNKPDESDTNQ